MMERFEEMNRMREHVMNEVDKNHDKLISLEEFLESTKNADFKKDEGWDVSMLLVECLFEDCF
jgi:nucleobindin